MLVGGAGLAVFGLLLAALRPEQAPVGLSMAAVYMIFGPVIVAAKRRAGTNLRALCMLAFLHVLCAAGLWQTGPLMGVGAGMAATTIAAARFFGWRGALTSAAATAVVVAATGVAYVTGLAAAPVRPEVHWATIYDWGRIAGTTAFIALVVGLTMATIAAELERAGAQAARSLAGLQTRRAERERSREVLAIAARDEALGRLAGGVAHDVNNAFAVVLTNAELLAEAMPEGSEDRSLADEMVGAAQRAAKTTRGLLMLGRSQLEPERPASAAAVCEHLVELLRRTCPESVGVRLESSGSRRPTLSASALEQLVLTQALDALDIIGPEGELVLRVSDLDDAAGRRVRIEVECARRGRTSDPWSTISEVRRSLPPRAAQTSSKRILESAGGRMTFVSTHSGSSVVLELPELPAPAVPTEPPAAPPLERRGLRVLVVEDEEPVRRTLVRVLEPLGYSVVEAHDGASAHRSFEGPERIDLLLTDAVMPNTSTAGMLRAFRALHPATPIVICSGFVQEELLRRGIAEGAYAFLPKPFSPDELRGVVEAALAAAPAQAEAGA